MADTRQVPHDGNLCQRLEDVGGRQVDGGYGRWRYSVDFARIQLVTFHFVVGVTRANGDVQSLNGRPTIFEVPWSWHMVFGIILVT